MERPATSESDRTSRLNRRRMLKLSGIAGSVLLAGCNTDDESPDDTDEPPTGDEPRETTAETPTDDDGTPDATATEEDRTFQPAEIVRIDAGGEGFGGDGDEGYLYYEEVSGDFDVAVHCQSLEVDGESRAERGSGESFGLMVRSSLEPDATMAYLRRRPHPDVEFVTEQSAAWLTWRTDDGVSSEVVDGPRAEWLRVRREGSDLDLFTSTTGEDWELFDTLVVPDDVDLGEDVYLGLAAAGAGSEKDRIAATFKDLSGLSPADGVDIGDPDHPGEVTVREDIPYATTLEPQAGADELTARGRLYLPEAFDEAECSFAYRRFDEDEWHTTDPQTLAASGTFEASIDADSRRLYLLIAFVKVNGAPRIPPARPTVGATLYRGSGSPAPGDGDGELSAGVSHFGLDDGFADPAPWLDDETPIITITEPSRDQLYEAFRVPHERLVVFETSGVVDLRGEQLSIRTDKCYVAGQTAPSPGITFVGEGIQIAADDCVLQHVRSRAGDASGEAPTTIYVQDTRRNNVVDHCTATWGVDENLTVGGETANTTYSNNLVAEALKDSTHPKGEHSMGSLINPEAKNVALLGNVWAHNVNRNPRLRLATTSVVVNNLIFNFSDSCWMDPQARASIVGNAYLRPRTSQPIVISKSLDYGEGIPKAYLEDNFTDGDIPLSPSDDSFEELDEKPLWPDGLEAMDVVDTHDHNLANVGARPADRAHHDERIVDLVRNREGDWIDSQDEVGGYPDLAVNTHSLDVPDSGTRAWLREKSLEVEQ